MPQIRDCSPMRSASVLSVLLLVGVESMPATAQPQPSGGSIVDETLQDIRKDEERDAGRVRGMVDEAMKGASGKPSGEEIVNPAAPAALLPLSGDVPELVPTGYDAAKLKDRPVRDGAGDPIGTSRGLARDEASGVTLVMVELAPLFGKPAKVSVMPVELLVPAVAEEDGYVVELTPVAHDAMPAYRWAGEAWRRDGT